MLRCQSRGFSGIACINVDGTLASFAGLPLVAEHVLQEADGEVSHGHTLQARSIDKDRGFEQVIVDGLHARDCLRGHADSRALSE